jgi:protein-tyrosine phosphatase
MSEQELTFYSRLELQADDLVFFYRNQGFEVNWLPWKDPAHVRTDREALRKKVREVSEKALEAFDLLQKPVLLHCSAGVDRSAPVAAYIRERRSRSERVGAS